jgi:hypothetical protein
MGWSRGGLLLARLVPPGRIIAVVALLAAACVRPVCEAPGSCPGDAAAAMSAVQCFDDRDCRSDQQCYWTDTRACAGADPAVVALASYCEPPTICEVPCGVPVGCPAPCELVRGTFCACLCGCKVCPAPG